MRKLYLLLIVCLCACSKSDSSDVVPPTKIALSSPATAVAVSATSSVSNTENLEATGSKLDLGRSPDGKNTPLYLLDDLFAQAKAIKLKEEKIVDLTMALLTDGDFVEPTFSPDSKKLAYSNVVLLDTQEGKQEIAEVSIFDVESKKSRLMLPREQSKQYAVYGTFVTSMSWPDTNRIQINLSDGDVDGTELLINSSIGKLISEKSIEAGIDEKTYQKIRDRVSKLSPKFPAWKPEILENAIEHNSLTIEDQSIILQRAYHGYDNNIVLLDLTNNEEKLLIQMRDQDRNSLVGGVVIDGEAIFSVRTEDGVGIFKLTKKHAIVPLAFFAKEKDMAFPWLNVKYTSQSDAFLLLRLYSPSIPGNNPVLYYSANSGVLKLTDFSGIYDFDVSKNRKSMAVSFWENEHRKISVVRLREDAL